MSIKIIHGVVVYTQYRYLSHISDFYLNYLCLNIVKNYYFKFSDNAIIIHVCINLFYDNFLYRFTSSFLINDG